MALALNHAFLFLCFLFFPNVAYSFTCGNFSTAIKLPFTTTAEPSRVGLDHLIECDGTNPMIKFYGQGASYLLRSITYSPNIITVQPVQPVDPPWGLGCSFLYDFGTPLAFKNLSDMDEMILSEVRFYNCTMLQHYFSKEFVLQFRNYNYNFYYTRKLDDETLGVLPTGCLARAPLPLFERNISFSEDNSDLSLSSIGFSHQLELRVECFNCKAIGDDCSVNGAPTGHSATFAKKNIIIGVISGTAVFLLVVIFLYQCLKRKFHYSIFWKKKTKGSRAIKDFLESYGALTLKTYSYSELKKITKSFSDKLGQGGYGTVFKGTLSDGHHVAVKVLSESKGNGEEFINEVASIGRTSHVNIVSLLGFCLEDTKRALVYDFMPNGSLEKYIYGEISDSMKSLSWEKLYNIAIGIARGLEYLHQGCNTRIVHFDIKPHNILLDEDFCPKISDFGLAKLCPHKESILSMVGARGTIGYIAPEVFSRNFGVVSSKSDVYSYGMMVLEMAGGRKMSSTMVNKNSEFYFPYWIYEHLNKHGTLQDWGTTAETEEIARKMILVGLCCIQTLPTNRPSIVRVVEMLSGSIADLHMPPKPYLVSPVISALGSIATSTS